MTSYRYRIVEHCDHRRLPPTNTPGGTPLWVIWLIVLLVLFLCTLVVCGGAFLAVVVLGL